MEINRRSFLGGAIVLAAVTALPAAAFAEVPVIYGDGVHDDWAGLQALLDGKPFRVVGEGPAILRSSESAATISGGDYLISRTLKIGRVPAKITLCRFKAAPDFKGKAVLDISGERSC